MHILGIHINFFAALNDKNYFLIIYDNANS